MKHTYEKSKTLNQVPAGGEAISAGSSGPSVDLSTALTGEALQPILSQEGFLDKVRGLIWCYFAMEMKIASQVKAFLPAGEEEGKEVTAADLKVSSRSSYDYTKTGVI